MSLAANALTTLQKQKDFLVIPDTTHDTILETLINSISTLFDRYTGRNLKEATYATLYLDGNGEVNLSLPNYPVDSIAAVVEDDITLTKGADYDYLLYTSDNDAYLAKVSGVWTTGRQGIKLTTLKAGFATVPADLEFACFKQVAFEFQKHKAKTWGETARTFPDGSITVEEAGELLKDVKQVLDRYRKLSL